MRRKEQPLVTKMLNNTPRYPHGAMVNQKGEKRGDVRKVN